jgi:hypothetical protein
MAVSRVKATLAKKEARKTIDHFAPTSGESGGGGFVRVHRLPPFVDVGFVFRFRKTARKPERGFAFSLLRCPVRKANRLLDFLNRDFNLGHDAPHFPSFGSA